MTAALTGYAESLLGWPTRALLASAGVALLWPIGEEWKLAALGVVAPRLSRAIA